MLYILRKGKPVPCNNTLAWARWLGEAMRSGLKRVARTYINKDIFVSTVFLGIDHNFLPWGPPVLWETMVFRAGNGEEQARYASAEAARAGHRKMVKYVRRKLKGLPAREP